MSVKPTQWILVSGNVVDGFSFAGPFPTVEMAADYGDDDDSEWCTAELVSPDDTLFEEKVFGIPEQRLFTGDWEVFVEDLATAYSGDDEEVARNLFKRYVEDSKSGHFQIGGKVVILYHIGEVVEKYDPKLDT